MKKILNRLYTAVSKDVAGIKLNYLTLNISSKEV